MDKEKKAMESEKENRQWFAFTLIKDIEDCNREIQNLQKGVDKTNAKIESLLDYRDRKMLDLKEELNKNW